MLSDIVSAKIIVKAKDGQTAEYNFSDINKMTGYKLPEKTGLAITGYEDLDFAGSSYNYVFAIDSDNCSENTVNVRNI